MGKTFNIKPSDAKYIVNEKKKVVVCIIDKTEHLFIDFSNVNFKISPGTISLFWGDQDFFNRLKMPNRFTGVATCSDDDEWNAETGKLIAFSRAKDKVNKSFFKRANAYINYLDRAVDEAASTLTIIGEKLSINTDHRHNLINSIIGEEPENGMQKD